MEELAFFRIVAAGRRPGEEGSGQMTTATRTIAPELVGNRQRVLVSELRDAVVAEAAFFQAYADRFAAGRR